MTSKLLTFTRLGVACAFLGLISLAAPGLALAEFAGGGGGGVIGLETSDAGASILGYTNAIVEFATGAWGIGLCTIGMLIAVGGMIYKSQRNQPFGKFGYAAVGVVLFFIVPQIVQWLGQASGAAF